MIDRIKFRTPLFKFFGQLFSGMDQAFINKGDNRYKGLAKNLTTSVLCLLSEGNQEIYNSEGGIQTMLS